MKKDAFDKCWAFCWRCNVTGTVSAMHVFLPRARQPAPVSSSLLRWPNNSLSPETILIGLLQPNLQRRGPNNQ